MQLDGFISIGEVADQLGVSYTAAYRFATSGALGDCARAGTMRLYSRANAANAIAARRNAR